MPHKHDDAELTVRILRRSALARSVGWVESEVSTWIAARVAERDQPLRIRRGKRQAKASDAEILTEKVS